jgi:catechol 2,3-dioxygenase-like lactoylglutathione lyase family enzyme
LEDFMKISPRLTVITLGVADMARAIGFYERLGLTRKLKVTGEAVAFFEAGAMTLALFPWDLLAADANQRDLPRPMAFRGTTLAWNCASREEVSASLAHALAAGGRELKAPHETDYGGFSGYFADPDGHAWEIVTAPGIEVQADGRVRVPD